MLFSVVGWFSNQFHQTLSLQSIVLFNDIFRKISKYFINKTKSLYKIEKSNWN